jgi:uncharacterized protein YqeY
MLKDEISKSLSNSMKNKDEKTTMALRNIRTKIIEAEKKDVTKEISDSEIISILTKLAKERKQSIEMYEQANRQDLIDSEAYELSVIESYLPKQMSVDEMKEKVKLLISENNFATIKDMGKTIKTFNDKYPGLADGKSLSQFVKEILT